MKMLTQTLIPLSFVTGMAITTVIFWYYWYKNTDNEKEPLLPKSSKYIIFLDIDGTVTKLPGDHPHSLFNLAQVIDAISIDEQVILYNRSYRDLDLISKFLRKLVATENIEIIITTNNYKSVVEYFWKKILKCPWEKSNINLKLSAFRGYTPNKVQLINQLVEDTDSVTYLYFEDDINYLSSNINSKVKVVNCSNGRWLGWYLTRYYRNRELSNIKDFLSSFDNRLY